MKNGRKTVFSILLCLCMVLQFAPSAAFAVDAAESGLCAHHTEHTAECGYSAAVEAHECHYECAECANSESTAVCDCGTDDPAIHATTCAVYVAPENPQCYCAEKCTEANVWCDVCGFDYTACTGTDTAAGYGTGWTIEETNLIVTGHLTALPEGVDYSEIEVRVGGKLDLGEATVTCDVDNDGTISGGIFEHNVYNDGTISGGIFENDVRNSFGWIIGGTFKNDVVNDGSIIGGTFTGHVYNYGTITDVTFWYATVSNKSESATISNAKFESNAKLAAGSTPPQSVIHSVNGKDVALTYNAPLPAALGTGAAAWYEGSTQVTGGTVPLNYTNYVGEYKISTAAATNGTVSVPATAKYGQTVTVTATAFGGYALDTVTVHQGEAAVTVTDNAFTMPAGDVTVSATFARCNHSGSEHTTATNNGDGTHHFVCSVCRAGVSEAHTINSTTGKCVCGLEMAVAKVTSAGVDTYYETLSAALAAAKSGDTVTLCADVNIGTTAHTIPAGVNFSGGEYTVSGNGAGWIYNYGTIEDGVFAFFVENYGTIKGGKFYSAINSSTVISGTVIGGIVIGGSFRSVDCDRASSLFGPVSVSDDLTYSGECSIDLTEASFDPNTYIRIGNASAQDLPVSKLHLPEGYAVQLDGSVVSVLPAFLTGYIVPHAHTYDESGFSDTYHWQVCDCGKTTVQTGHSYTYENNGENHNKSCSACDYTAVEDHAMISTTGKCACGMDMAVAAVTIGGNTTYAETLQAAINAIKSCTASDHAKITLLQSVALGSERLNVDSGVFVLDLNGCTLSGGHVDGVLYITGGDVTLTDSGEGGTATNTGSTHCVVVVNGGIINISGTVSISGNKGVMVRSGTANITGGNFTTSGLESCGVRVEGGTANIRGGTITSGKYGVYAGENGVAVISDGTISVTYSGVYVHQGAAIISGGTITGRDYGIFLYQNGSATVNGGTISGTLYVDGTLTLGLGSSGVGATFADGIAVEKSNLQDILSTAASVGYWAVVDGKNTMLNVDTASVAITDKGDITVKVTCTHPESSRTDYTPLEDGKHSYLCSLCQNTLTEDHTTVSAATCANPAVCGLCGEYGEKDAANHEETVPYDNGFCPHGCYEPAVLNGEVYEISNAGQLYWFAAKVNAGETAINGKLMANIVVNTGDVSGCGGAKQSSWRDWTPIGTNNYNGTFEGNNKTVSGLYCNNSSTRWLGLFSCVNKAGVVQNVGVINSYISGYSAVGGVVGSNYGTVINCYNSGTIIGDYSVGGVAGFIEGIKSGGTVIGGIMTGCYNSGTVTCDDYAGGVVGQVNNFATVTNCHNSSTVSGTMRVGGVTGYNSGTVISCHNSGTVIGTGDDGKLGGISGVVNDNYGTVANCYNSGTVSGNMNVAGVVKNNRAILTNCYNLGTVIGNKYIAGLVFTNYGTIASCYNFGTVTGNAGVSGALCYNNSTITNCYYLNTTAGVGILDEESNNADAAGLAEAKTAEQFASGEVAYLLQGEQTEQVWGQDIGTDDYPDFVSARVYYGYTSCGDTGMKYTNDSAASQTKPDHTGALGTPVPTGDGTQHVATWSCCGNTVTGPHTLALTYVNLDADGHKAYYPCCQQAGDVEATDHEYENGCCICTDVKEFTLSFYASDGDETPVATFSVPYGTELIRQEEDEDDNVTFFGATDYLNALIGQIDTSTLKKEHYTFRSWDLETGPGSMYKDESIFGIWNPVSYGITWDLAGGYAQYPEELPTVYDYGYSPMLWTGFAREGYTLSHFTDQYGQAYTLHERSDHYSMEPILPGGNLTLTAVWDANAYILHAQDQSLDVDYGTALTDALSGIAPEKTGYTLTGWKFYLDEGCTEEYTGTTMPAYSVYAQPAFEPIQYNITWELNGCTVDSNVSHALPETLPYNGDADHKHQVKVFLNAPEGYTFTGFRDGNGNELEYSMANSWLFLTVTGDMTVEAIVEPNTYMATWDNGDGGSYDVGVKYGEVITVPTSEFFQDTFRKAGYTLVGWEGYTEGMTMPIGGVTIKAKWHINPASLAVPSGKYTGEAHAPAVTVAGLTEGEDFTVSYPADMTNVGEKIITVSGKYGGSVTVTYTIEKADPPVITFPEVLNSITYGQMLEDVKLSFYENEYGTFNWTAPIGVPNAGTNGYALDFYPEDLTNYDWAACNWQTHNATWIESRSALCAMGQVQVDKAEPVYTAPTAIEGLVYTGSSQELISVSEVQVEGGELLLSRDGNIYSQNLPAETDAGEYTVWYYVRGDDNHTDSAKKSVSVTIARKELTPTVTGSMSKSYDGTNAVPERHSLNIVLNGVISGDTVTASADFAFAGVNAGTKTIKATNITLSGEDAKNYTLKSTSASADVGEIVVLDLQYLEPHDYSIVFGSSPVYNGKEQTVTVESFVMCGMDVTYELTGNTGTEAGTYTMTVTATGNFAGTVEEGWQITRKPVTITAKDQTVTYGNAISGAEITSIGLIEGHSVTATLTPSTANVTANGSITASAAVITADGTDVTANYEITYVDGKLVIEPDTSGIDDLTAENVTSANEADIKAVQEMLENADSVKDEWAATDDKCSQLLDRIDEVEAEQKELTDAAADFDPETVKSTEKEDLEQLAEDIEALLDTENLTEDERDGLEAVLEQVNDMIDTVEDAAEASKDATEAIDARDPATVTSADEDELEQAIGTIDKLLQDGHLTEEERNALEDAKAEAEALIDVIEKAQNAASTENTEKVENVTPENVKPEDKADLEKAKTDLEKALEDNGGNYTEEEKKSVEDEIDRIEAAVAALENAEDVTASIAQLPESVEPDDEAAAEKILAAKEAFDGLTDHEKSLVDEASREKLDELVAALIAYDIIKGDGSEWIKGSDGSLSFTANGPFSKFVGIEVDGEEVDAKHYEAKSGSTIITLKQSFLMNLAAGEHTLTVIYTDGETSGTFRIHAKSLTPTTGDDSRILLYVSMLTVSLAALAVLLPAARKRKKENS